MSTPTNTYHTPMTLLIIQAKPKIFIRPFMYERIPFPWFAIRYVNQYRTIGLSDFQIWQRIDDHPELKTYIDRQKQRGVANIIGFEIEYHRRFANTAAAFILTLIGMSLSSRKVKGGMGFNIAMGLLLSFSYILFDMVSSTFAISGATSPQIAVWIPNILYAFIAIGLYFKAPK